MVRSKTTRKWAIIIGTLLVPVMVAWLWLRWVARDVDDPIPRDPQYWARRDAENLTPRDANGPVLRKLEPVATSLRCQPIYTRALRTLDFNPEGTLLATGSGDGRIQLWNMADSQLERSIQAHSQWVFSVSFSPDGRLLASGGGDNIVKIWDPATGKKLHELAGHTDDVHGVVFLGDSHRLASVGDDQNVRIWDLSAPRVSVLTGHGRQVTAAAISPAGGLLATASRDATIRLWVPDTGRLVGMLEGHDADVLDLAFANDGKQLVTASYDLTARLWDVQSGKPLRTFSGHGGWVFAVAVSPDDKELATGSGDKKLRLWDLAGGDLKHTIDMGQDISALEYTPDGRMLAMALTDGTVRMFDVRAEVPRETSRMGTTQDIQHKKHQLIPTDPQPSAAVRPDEYLNLHQSVMAPGDDTWKNAVARLTHVGDGFTLQVLNDIDKSQLSPEDATLLASAMQAIEKSVSSQDAAQVATAVRQRLERAAAADLQCHPLEGRIVPWARNSILPYAADPAVRQELVWIRDHYDSDQELPFGSLRTRVRSFATQLLQGEQIEATR